MNAVKMNVFGEQIAIALYAAQRHPQRALRDRLMRDLTTWVDAMTPLVDARSTAVILQEERGTALEPFVLDEYERDCAVLLARLALSESSAQVRFRIGSADAMGSNGGCMLMRSGRHYFVERFALGRHRQSPQSAWFYAPGACPPVEEAKAIAQVRHSARCQVTDNGYAIRLAWVDTEVLGWDDFALKRGKGTRRSPRVESGLPARLEQHSSVGLDGVTLQSLGCRVEQDSSGWVIRAGTAEAIVRLTAHMQRRDAMVLDVGAEQQRGRIVIGLEPPQGDTTRLNARSTVVSPALADWVRIEPRSLPEFRDADLTAISKWLAPKETWLNPKLLELLL